MDGNSVDGDPVPTDRVRLPEQLLWGCTVAIVATMFLLQLILAQTAAAPATAETVPEVSSEIAELVGLLISAALLAGLALLALGWARYLEDGFRLRFQTVAAERREPFLEVFLLFVLGAQAVGALVGGLSQWTSALWPLWSQFLLLGVLFWPKLRGISEGEALLGLGIQRGEGVWREIGIGALAYLASLPILAVALAASIGLARFTARPYHPVVDWLSGSGSSADVLVVVAIAVIWAPLVEEAVFRGSLHTYLRSKMGLAASAGIGALFFAALHPQGIAGLPFLFTLGLVLIGVREWRGSIIACVTMHFIHNGITLLLMTALMR